MKLTYPTEPEITTIITPLGNVHHIPVWMPVGERTPPVMVEVAPPPTLPEPPKPPAERKARIVEQRPIHQRIADYMREGGDKGFSVWQIAYAIGENRHAVGQNLLGYKHLFWRSSATVTIDYYHGRGQMRHARLPLWHLQKEDE